MGTGKESGLVSEGKRPDIVVFLTDQFNPRTLGCAGDPVIQTPHIDSLADEGVFFDAAYSVCPVCMPARGSLVSGLYPHNHGFWSNYTERAFPAELATVFNDIRGAGYLTAQIGKFHHFNPKWGGDFEDHADYYRALGFEFAEETTGPYMTPFHKAEYTRYLQSEGLLDVYLHDIAERLERGQYTVKPSPVPPDAHNDAFIGRRATEFIGGAPEDRPLCLVVSFPGPHTPMDAPGEYYSMYDPADVPMPPNVQEVSRPKGQAFTLDMLRRMRANYYGKITLIDDWVGRVIEAMRRRGTWDNTLAFFTADHGEMLGAHGAMGKCRFCEESSRVPMIVRWPGRAAPGRRTGALAEIIDVGASVIDAIGAIPTDGQFGRSLLPVLTGQAESVRDAAFSEIRMGGDFAYMVRAAEYKWWRTPKQERLHDVSQDPYELNDLSQSPGHERVREEMKGRLADFLMRTQIDWSRGYQPLFTRAGIAAGAAGVADSLYKQFSEFHA